ncbi:deoxyribonuclease-2-alpha isoform X2 [Grammomys surdaster]|uniref:deoxyribonuclease-2-alpha isoform X2 n=1 Tax=Grammomys surdaster TaxID=491861 RepID=UPI00109EF124|nr:deoxyribonuclease-2-alpha isoform X2 [Grammomys surdaster]
MAAPRSLLLAALLWVPAEALSCYGDSGQPVDWFVVYKLPAHSGSGDTPWKGLMYKYMDQNSDGWQDGVGYINSSKGAVGLSLQPLYRKNSSQLAFLLYNDQPPKSSSARNSPSHGHTKGVLLLDQEGGFWLVHSVPRFPLPASSGTYSWPPNAQTYGQTLLCVSVPFTEFTRIDLYSGWLAEALGTNLQVQFWQNSPGILPSNCSGTYQILDVTQTAFPGPSGPSFSATEDHSKWCVAPQGPWACVGDMNRNKGETHRGGGTLCTQLPSLWKAFRSLVKACKPCGDAS